MKLKTGTQETDELRQTKEEAIFSRLPELEARVHTLVEKFNQIQTQIHVAEQTQVCQGIVDIQVYATQG